jgi:hypothetical protein
MLRDDRQTALNDAIEACLHAAHVHEDDADLLGDDAAGARQLAARRREDAEILAEHLRRLGDLPKEPDPEYEVAADIVTRIKASLAEDERALALARSKEAEDALAAALEAVLEQDVTPDCRKDVERILASRATLD